MLAEALVQGSAAVSANMLAKMLAEASVQGSALKTTESNSAPAWGAPLARGLALRLVLK